MILILILNGCAGSDIDSMLEPFVDEFERELDVVVTYDVIIDDIKKYYTETDAHAVCQRRGLSKRVVIDYSWAEEVIDEKDWEIVVWHELGHCSLGLEHAEHADSWMYENVDQMVKKDNHEFYKEEMKSRYDLGL